jgi:hypothetical protein
VTRRTTWLIDMGDGTWAVSCMACRIALYRGPKAGAERAARGHYCEPVLPLGRPSSQPRWAAPTRTRRGRTRRPPPTPHEGASS